MDIVLVDIVLEDIVLEDIVLVEEAVEAVAAVEVSAEAVSEAVVAEAVLNVRQGQPQYLAILVHRDIPVHQAPAAIEVLHIPAVLEVEVLEEVDLEVAEPEEVSR